MASNSLVQANRLRTFCTAAFERAGLSPEDAAILADTLVEADLRGVHSHGVWWTATYVNRFQAGGLNPRPQIQVVRETGGIILLDADEATGQVAGVAAMRRAMQKASEIGVGVASVHNSNHFGAAAFYAMMAAKSDQIGFASTDAEPIMAPWGGAKAVVGNNPMAYAIPVTEDFSIVLDMAQSVVAWGKIYLAAQRDEKIPKTWALNQSGEPTDDAHEAMAGLLLPVGDYKGYGLALVVEILAGVLSGATFGLSVPPMSDDTVTQDFGHFFMALDIDHFLPLEDFRQRMAHLVTEHRDVPLAQGTERVYLPGEIEHLKRQDRLANGIPLEASVVESLRQVGAEMKLDTGFLHGDGP